MKLRLPSTVSRKLARQALVAEKHSPTIFFAVGVAGTIASTALACRATLNLERVLQSAADQREATENALAEGRKIDADGTPYGQTEYDQDQKTIKIQTAVEIAKLYMPAVGVGALAIASLTHSHNILNKRNAAISAAYAALDKGFREYRARVVEHYGEEKDLEFRYGTEKVTITDEETGRKKNIVQPPVIADGSIYARIFDPFNENWSEDPEYNMIFLRNQQRYLNDLLHARGHVFLNDVYDALGFKRSKAGVVVGWVLGDDGDNYIDFGIFDKKNQSAVDFVNARDNAILLDFNVDGLIYDKIEDQGTVAWQS